MSWSVPLYLYAALAAAQQTPVQTVQAAPTQIIGLDPLTEFALNNAMKLLIAALGLWGTTACAVLAGAPRAFRAVKKATEVYEHYRHHFIETGNGNALQRLERCEERSNSNGAVLQVISRNQDLGTQRARMTEHLLPHGVVDIDADGRIYWANRAFREMTGSPIEDLRADAWRRTIHPDDLGYVDREWSRLRQSGRAGEALLEYRRVLPDGRVASVRTVVRALVFDGVVEGWRATVEKLGYTGERRARPATDTSPPSGGPFNVPDLGQEGE